MRWTSFKLFALYSVAALGLSSAPAQGGERDELRLMVAEQAVDPLEIRMRIQSRYAYNKRDAAGTTFANPGDEITAGFVNRRVNLSVRGRVSDRLTTFFQLATGRGSGDISAELAFATLELTEGVTLSAGLLRSKFAREEHLSASNQLAIERSAGNETFNQGFTEGIDLTITKDKVRVFFSITDGFSADHSLITDTREADFAFTGRIELRFGEASWHAYRQFTSFRGSSDGVLVGAALAYQFGNDTNVATTIDTAQIGFTTDASVVRDGWNAFASALINHTSMDAVADRTDVILLAQGGVFISEHDELFARWNGVFPDEDNGLRSEDFQSLSFGWNHYVIPESHAAKLTIEVVVALDPTTTSIVQTSDSHNLLPDSETGQTAVTVQMQLLF